MSCIIAFSGLPQTGKTTLARLLARELKCKFVSFGDFVRQEALNRGILNATRHDLQNLGQSLVTENVSNFCRSVLRTVEFSGGEQIVLDGVRHKEVLEAISEISQKQPIKLVLLIASEKARRNRSLQDIDSIDSHRVESEVKDQFRSIADLVIETDNDEAEALGTLLDWIRKDPDCKTNNSV
jgi:cytidylate kinase